MRQIHGIASRLRDKPDADPFDSEQMPTTYPESLTFRPTHCGPEDAYILHGPRLSHGNGRSRLPEIIKENKKPKQSCVFSKRKRTS